MIRYGNMMSPSYISKGDLTEAELAGGLQIAEELKNLGSALGKIAGRGALPFDTDVYALGAGDYLAVFPASDVDVRVYGRNSRYYDQRDRLAAFTSGQPFLLHPNTQHARVKADRKTGEYTITMRGSSPSWSGDGIEIPIESGRSYDHIQMVWEEYNFEVGETELVPVSEFSRDRLTEYETPRITLGTFAIAS
jgi:hypothetical protein